MNRPRQNRNRTNPYLRRGEGRSRSGTAATAEISPRRRTMGATADKSAGMQVLSQLEILRDSCKHFAHEKECFSPREGKSGCFSDDEVENPLFDDDEDGSTRPPRLGSASHSIQGIMHLPTMSSNSPYDEEISDGEDIMKGGREASMVLGRYPLSLGDGVLDDDDELPQAFDGELPYSSGDEENPQPPKSAIPMRAMADQFCEAFGAVSGHGVRPHLTFPGPLCSSSKTYGKLQSLLQAEKERDVVFLKHTSGGTCSMDEKNSIKVRILSKRLEAKLVACSCTVIGDRKFQYLANDLGTKSKVEGGSLTVIFNPRICSNVELEVDNVICIHSPWQEVQVKGKDDEVVLLSSYYCHDCY